MDEFLSDLGGRVGLLILLVPSFLLVCAELGYRRGVRDRATADEWFLGHIGGVQAAVLALLGLLMGFTFSMGVDRFDHRRALVLEEAQAIRTAWWRASLLQDAPASAVRDLLRKYVDIRILPKAAPDPRELAERMRRSVEIQVALWRYADAAAAEAPDDITALFVESVNDIVDIHAGRVQATRSRIPSGVWIIVMAVAAVGCWTSTYSGGASGVRSRLTGVMLPLLVSLVMLLIFDLTNERHGLIHISQQPLIDVQASIASGRWR
jgi:hypothetical protein